MGVKTGRPGPDPIFLPEDEPRIIMALEEAKGIIKGAAHLLRVHRATLHKYIQHNPHLRPFIDEQIEDLKDIAETHVARSIMEGDMQTVRWYLEKKARDRGYDPRVAVSGPDGGAIPVEMKTTVDVSKLSTEALREIAMAAIADDSADAR